MLAELGKNEKPVTDSAFGEGIYFAGERYVLTKADEEGVYCRKVRRPTTCVSLLITETTR
jgi:hypothetical protein